MIGANVVAKGTTNGVSSDVDGNYSIVISEDAAILVFTYTGYAKKEVNTGTLDMINVQMASGETLDEVVVIGYGTVKKEDATGALQTVGVKDFNKGAITSAQDLLSGKVAGVNISPSSDPGGGSAITIRGTSSLSASNSPLIVIDGVPTPEGGIGGSRNPLNIVNANDIESITVLKDASATAIYGSRASGGVILITTKKGKSSAKLSIGYNGNFSVGQVVKTVDVLSADEYRTLVTNQFGEGSAQAELLGDANTDWQSEIYQNAIGTDHNLNFSGGVQGLPYRLSLGYTNKTGVLKTDQFQRSTVALNLNPGFLDNTLQVNISAKLVDINNTFANRGAIGTAVGFDPTQAIRDAESPYDGYFTWTQNNGNPITIAPANPLALLNLVDDQSDVRRYILNGSVDYRMPFLPELRANLNLGYDYSYGEGSVLTSGDASFAFQDTGAIADYNNTTRNELLEFYLNYNKDYDFGKIDLMAGYSWQHFFFNNYSFSRNLSGTQIYSEEDESPREYYLVSLFGRLNYTLQDKYLFTFTLRRDGSSRFSPDTRWGLFPSAAFAYKIVEEQGGTLNNLKLRLGYGVTGQQDIGGNYYPYLPVYVEGQPNAAYQLGNTFYNTLRPSGYDANLKWEETTTYNAGIDFTLFGDRLSGTLDVYQKLTKDLLNFIPVPVGTNLTNAITTNVGDMTNNGIELSLSGTPIKTDKITWEITGNIAFQSNEITRLTAINDPDYQGVFTGGISGGVGNTIQIHSVGFPLSSFFVYEQVYDDQGNPIEGEYVDRNDDGAITPDDRYRFENPAPDAFYGISTRISYDRFELTAAGRGNIGNYIYNNVWSDGAFTNRIYNNTGFLSNVHAQTPNINFEVPQYFSDYFIQNGSFFRLDHVTLSYRFPEQGKVRNLTVFATVNNALVISKYTGIDPEIGGIDNNAYPRARTTLFGVSAQF